MTVKAAYSPTSFSAPARLLPALLVVLGLGSTSLLAISHLLRDAAPARPAMTDEHASEQVDAPAPEAAPQAAPIVAPPPRATGHFLGLIPDSPHRPAPLAEAVPDAPDAAPVPPKRPQFAHEIAPAARPAAGPAVAAPAATQEPRGIFDRLFNIQPSTGQALAYARPDVGVGAGGLADKPMPMGYEDGKTAVYDISAKMVFMPNGEKLEAHSGLGPLLDDPNKVHVKNRGATPPNVYNLSLRESLFHGVQALRMTPVGGSTMYGRDGILAHTYMLGPNGDSNGCVSFRDYNRFLQAFNAGDVKRIIVVARRG